MVKQNSSQLSFADKLLNWYDNWGRKDLPWQTNRTPYRVWLSEIMLQQTQVATVIPYFEQFTARFPHIYSLAGAHLDDVLHLWAGLGYYSRARNLHRTARIIRDDYKGEFPCHIEELIALPGIGRSTAGAILALSREERHPILDGNVKRVLCRYYAVEGWPGETATEKQLWKLAEGHTPQNRIGDYTQAIMDLGATLCKRSGPECVRCPFQHDCQAHAAGKEKIYPHKREGKKIPERDAIFLIIREEGGDILLEKRPPSGIWGGLWSLPQLNHGDDVDKWCKREGIKVVEKEDLPSFRHTFSHYHLHIYPVKLRVMKTDLLIVREGDALQWHSPKEIKKLGLPAPVKKLINLQLSFSS